MKISKKKLQMWSVILVLILNAMCFFLMPVTNLLLPINSYHNKILIVSITLMIFIVIFLKKNYKFNSLDLIIISFILMVLLIFGIQLILKEDSFYNLFGNMYFLFAWLLYFPIKELLKKDKAFFLRILIYVGVIYAFVNFAIYIYIKTGNTYVYDTPLIQYVNNKLRLPQSADIVGLTFIITLYYLCISKKDKFKFSLILFFLGVVLIVVSQVRMMQVSVFISSLVIVYQLYKKRIKNVKFLSFFLIFLCIVIILYVPFLGNLSLIENFLGEGQQYASAMYRVIEIKHYSQFMFMNIIFGFGFTNQPDIITYAVTDIGIFAFVFRYGILGVLWLLFLAQTFYKKKKFTQNKILFWGSITFFFTTFISLSMFDPQRIVLNAIIFSLIDNASNVELENNT